MKNFRTTPPHISDLTDFVMTAPEILTLGDGIKLSVLRADEGDPVRFDLVFGGGYLHQSQPLQALFTNRMLREGTKSFTASQIADELDRCGALLELTASAAHTYLTLYSTHRHLPRMLALLESMVKEPIFPSHELDILIDANIHRFRVNRSKVDYVSHRTLANALYGDCHPYGRLLTEDDYHALTPDALRSFHSQCYHADGCSLFLSGGVTPEVIKYVEQHFGNTPWGKCRQALHTPAFASRTLPAKRLHIEHPDAPQSSVRLGMISIPHSHPDYLKVRVMLTLFGGYFGSRLMSNIREEKGYTYGITAGIAAYPDSGMLMISAETDPRFVEPLIGEVYHEIDRLQNELVTDGELTQVRRYMTGELFRNYESPFALSDAWIFVQTNGLSTHYFEQAAETIRSIQASEIRELACKYLCQEPIKEVVVGKKTYKNHYLVIMK